MKSGLDYKEGNHFLAEPSLCFSGFVKNGKKLYVIHGSSGRCMALLPRSCFCPHKWCLNQEGLTQKKSI